MSDAPPPRKAGDAVHDDHEEGYLPAVVGRPRRRVGRLVLGLLGVVVLGLLAMWTLAAVATDARLPRVAVGSLDGGGGDGLTNVLLVGTDSRDGLTDEQLLQMGTERVDGDRTDTIILVQVGGGRATPVMLSFPRDLRVEPPGRDATKVNAVYGKGGPELLVETIEATTGVQIDHYAEINISGILLLTDAVGGVEVCLDGPMVDRYAGVDLPGGCQVLDGVQASGFVRARKEVVDRFGRDDLGRIARQQYFIGRALKTALAPTTLVDPVKLKRLSDVATASLTVDDRLSPLGEIRLAWALRAIATGGADRRVVPSSWREPYMVADDTAAALFDALRTGAPLPDVGRSGPEDDAATPPG